MPDKLVAILFYQLRHSFTKALQSTAIEKTTYGCAEFSLYQDDETAGHHQAIASIFPRYLR